MAKQRKAPPPPPKKQKGSIFPVNELGLRPQDYGVYTFNRDYAIPGLPALTEMYGDVGLGFLAGLLGTTGMTIDDLLAPPTKAKQKGKDKKKKKEPDIAAAPSGKGRKGDRSTDFLPPGQQSYIPVPPRIAPPQISDEEELALPQQQRSMRNPLPALPQSNFLNQLMQSLEAKRAAERQLSPLRSNIRYFVNPGNVPRAAYGGVPQYQTGTPPTPDGSENMPEVWLHPFTVVAPRDKAGLETLQILNNPAQWTHTPRTGVGKYPDYNTQEAFDRNSNLLRAWEISGYPNINSRPDNPKRAHYIPDLGPVNDLIGIPPGIRVNSLKDPTGSGYRYFDEGNRYFDTAPDIIAELPHALQDKQGKLGIDDFVRSYFLSPYLTNEQYRNQYKTPGTYEFEAHKVYEPIIRNYIKQPSIGPTVKLDLGGEERPVPQQNWGGSIRKYQTGTQPADGSQPKCPDGYQFNGTECIPTPPTTGTQQTPTNHICPERYKWDEAQQKCVPFGMADNAKWAYTNINQIGQGMPGLGLVGQAGMNMAQAPGFKPDVGLGTMSGAMQGFAQGGILGAVGGGLMGFLSTGRDLDAYNTEADRFQRARVQNANVPPNLGYYAQYGGETPGAVPSQTETGEIVLFPDNTLPEVKASLRHSQMGDEEVTDMLPENSYVFSDDKDMKFDLKAMKDKVLGYGMSYYDEHSNYPTETMRFGDIMPESGKMTFASAARILRSKVPTVGNKKDIFDIVTDADNLETRVPYIMELINLQDTKNASEGRTESTMGPQSEQPMGGPGEMPMMQAWGGMVPKYQRGDSYRYVRPGSSGYVQPTRQDSLDLLANTKALTDYYNRQGYTLEKRKSLPPNNPDPIYSLNWSARKYDPNQPRSYPTVTADGKVVETHDPPLPIKYYHKPHPSDPNKFYQREGADAILDTRAPFGLYDRRIIPTIESEYRNNKEKDALQGDLVYIYNYDPLAITPIDILYRQNPALVKERERKYGLSAGDKKFLESKGSASNTATTQQTPTPAPAQQQQPTPEKEKEKLYQYWFTNAETGEKTPMTAEDYEKYKNLNKEVRGTVDSSKYDIIPYVKQFGGIPHYQYGPTPTYQDSLALYNNELAKRAFYENHPDYVKMNNWPQGQADRVADNLTNAQVRAQLIQRGMEMGRTKPIADKVKAKYPNFNENRFGYVPGTNVFSFGDIIDTSQSVGTVAPNNVFNPKAPPVYLHPSISPHGVNIYQEYGGLFDRTVVPYYDPLTIKPYNLLTPEERTQREKTGPSKIRVDQIVWKNADGTEEVLTKEEYDRRMKNKQTEELKKRIVPKDKVTIVPAKQFGGMGSIIPSLMEKTYDKSIGSKFLGDKGKALIPIVTTALGVPAIKYGKKWTIIED